MTNCVHPVNVGKALAWEFNQTELVRNRFKGIQANASHLTPEELDCCCGTDERHIEELAKRIKLK